PVFLAERLLPERHEARDSPDRERLLSLGREAVALRAHLPIGREHVEPNPCRKRRLAVFPRNFDVDRTKAAVAVVVHPPEDRRQDEALPRLEHQVPGLPPAPDVGETLDEKADRLWPVNIEPEAELSPLGS